MAHPSKAKGDKGEREAAALIVELTGWPARRKLGAGRTDDTGDLDGIPDTTVQVKSYRDFARAIRDGLDDLRTQQANAGTPFAALMVRRTGGHWVVAMDLDQWAALTREATRPETS
jgi:hypothetical protein